MGFSKDFSKDFETAEPPGPVTAQDLWEIIVQMQRRLDRLDQKPPGENSLPPIPPKP